MKRKLIALITVLVMVLLMNSTALAAGGATSVNFVISESQINVEVPLNASVVVNATTGALTFPSSTDYKMTNNSKFAVMVTSITCAATTGWTLVETATGSDDIIASVTPGSGTAVKLLTAAQTCTETAWNMAANGGEIALTLAGSIGTPGPKTEALTMTGATAFTITYTIEAGAH